MPVLVGETGRLVPEPRCLYAHGVPGTDDTGSRRYAHTRIAMLVVVLASGTGSRALPGVCRKSYRRASYLVDPASSHMLVSKIKPCMSKYKLLHSETANGSLNQLWFLRSYNPTWITVVILELIHATKLRPPGKSAFIRSKPIGPQGPSHW